MKRYAYDPDNLDLGFYVIEESDDRTQFRWAWSDDQRGEVSDRGPWHSSRSGALRSAATNWDESGSGGRLAATLRARATRLGRSEDGGSHVHDWDDSGHPAPARLGPFACRCGQSVWLTATRPPAGWSVFGSHVDDTVSLEFSAAVDRDLMPAWERPAATI